MNFREWIKENVQRFAEQYGKSEANSFASWVIGYLLELGDDDAILYSDTLDKGDQGIDGWYYDEQEQIFHLFQVKYAEKGKMKLDQEPIRQLFNGLRVVDTEDVTSIRNKKLIEISKQFKDAKENEAVIVLNCILFCEVDEKYQKNFKKECDNYPYGNVRGEIWDISRLEDLYISRETDEDLKDQKIRIELTECNYLIIPEPKSKEINIGESIVLNLDAKKFISAIRSYSPRIFNSNVRYHLGHRNKVNVKIKETLISDELHEQFWHYNNGITILVNECKVIEENNILELTNPQIVNGCQTVSTMIDNFRDMQENIRILTKIIKVNKSDKGSAEAVKIAEATNSQSPVKAPDLKSNDLIQKQIQIMFKSLTPAWYYERKRGEWGTISKAEKTRLYGKRKIGMVELGQTWLSYMGNPARAIANTDLIFSDTLQYKKVYKKDIDIRVYLLSKILFDEFDKYFSMNNIEDIQKLSNISEKTLSRLLRGKKLVVAHSVALTRYLFEKRYGIINGKKADRLIKFMQEDDDYKNVVFKIVCIRHNKFVEQQEESADIRALYKNDDTIEILEKGIEEYLETISTVNKTLENALKSIED